MVFQMVFAALYIVRIAIVFIVFIVSWHIYSQNKLLGVSNLEQTYISTGFANWKEAISRFASHEGSRCHKDALLKMVSLPAAMRLSIA